MAHLAACKLASWTEPSFQLLCVGWQCELLSGWLLAIFCLALRIPTDAANLARRFCAWRILATHALELSLSSMIPLPLRDIVLILGLFAQGSQLFAVSPRTLGMLHLGLFDEATASCYGPFAL